MLTYIAGTTKAAQCAGHHLAQSGIPVTDVPRWDVNHLLLDVPSFRSGVRQNLDTILASLPRNITIWGGNLNHQQLEGYRCVDLLRDETYLMANAGITAECTLTIAKPLLHTAWIGLPVLIIGYGRIGKQLAPLLAEKGCQVTIAVRRASTIPQIEHDGFHAVDISNIHPMLQGFRMVINTAPSPVLSAQQMASCFHCIKIDLASIQGITCDDVVWARGLPGIYAPEASGKLIAETILRILKEEQP